MESKKIINFSEVSLLLTGNKNTIRSNRESVKYSKPINELIDFLDDWVYRNSKSKKAIVTIKNKNND